MREDYLTTQIVGLLRAHGLPAWKTHDSHHYPVEKGIADIHAVLPGGKFMALEVKKPGEENAHPERRAFQKNWLDWIERGGGETYTVSSLDEVLEILRTKGIAK